MCGLIGEFGPQSIGDSRSIAAILLAMFHRGPDCDGSASGDGWMLGLRRLAIFDLSEDGNQPMRSVDGRYVIVFNGAIYNYLELRKDLEAAGDVFYSGTDTEVLLRLLIRHGTGALNLLNGMFAFAFLDLHARRYLLARDRLGVKPLHLRLAGGTLRFASELNALMRWPGAKTGLNREAVVEYLALGYVPDTLSIRAGYTKLPPGSFAEGDLDRPVYEPRRWWIPSIAPDEAGARSEADTAEELDALLSDAVALRMRSDVPIALLLSGGIDSGLIGSYMTSAGAAPLALVAGFDREDYDETALAQETATHIGIDMRVMPLDESNLTEVDRVARAYDEPFGDPSALPMLHICEAASMHATVLLTGDGGDEAFAGYRRYLQIEKYRGLLVLPDALRRVAWELGRGVIRPGQARKLAKVTLSGTLPAAVFDGLGLMRDPALKLILADPLQTCSDVARSVHEAWNGFSEHDLLSRQRMLDYAHYLPGDILTKVDRASMAHSTEARSPFLDYRVVEFAARLPKRMLLRQGRGKQILRQLAVRRLPSNVAAGGKRGFGIPVGDWFRRPDGAALVRDRLLDPARNPERIWSEAGVASLLQQHLDGQRDCGEYLWRLLVLESWLRHQDAAASK